MYRVKGCPRKGLRNPSLPHTHTDENYISSVISPVGGEETEVLIPTVNSILDHNPHAMCKKYMPMKDIIVRNALTNEAIS